MKYDKEKVESLAQLILSGLLTEDDADQLVLLHLSVVRSIARRLDRVYSGNRYHDLVGEGVVAVITGVEDAKAKLHDLGITPFLIQRMKNAMFKYIARDFVVRVPRDRYRVGGGVMWSSIDSSDPDEELLYEISKSSSHDSGLMEEILRHCESDRDHKIVTLRIEGYTLRQIGKEVGLSSMTVSRWIRNLYQKLKR